MNRFKAVIVGLFLAVPGWCDITAIGAAPAGTNGSVQFNNRKDFGGNSDFTYSTSTKKLTVPAAAVSTITLNGQTYVFPTNQPVGYYLSPSAPGVLSWIPPVSPVGGGGASTLAVNYNGVKITSPTVSLNAVSPIVITSVGGGTTAQFSLDPSSVTLSGPLSVSSPLILSAGAFSLDKTSVTLRGQDPALGGDLSGTISHAFLNTVDISAKTNLAANAPLFLFGDTLNIDKSSATLLGPTIDANELPLDGYASTYVNTAGDTVTGQLTVSGSSLTVTGARGIRATYGISGGSLTARNLSNTLVAVDANGVLISTTVTGGGSGGGITGSINNATQFQLAYYNVTGSSNVLSGTNTIRLTSLGAIISTASISSATVSGQLTVGGPIVGNGAYLSNVPIMSPSATAPFPGPTVGNIDITSYYNTASEYKIGNAETLHRGTSGGLFVGSSNGTAAGTICMGDNACNSLGTSGVRNTGIGEGALGNDVSGEENACVGYHACLPTTSHRNSCVGAFSCGNLTTGDQNVGIGWDALPNSSSGTNNTCIGTNTCDLMTSGSSNLVIGDVAGADITVGNRNTCIGGDTNSVQPCTGIVSGSSNTAVGNGAGGNVGYVGNESANTSLGYKSAWAVGVNKSICIGYNCTVASSNTAQIGGTGVDAVRTIVSSLTISGLANTVLAVNAQGLVVSTTVTGGVGGSGIVSTDSPTWTGNHNFNGSTVSVSGVITDSLHERWIYSALDETNFFAGHQAGTLNLSGGYNVGIGHWACGSLTSGHQNTCIGDSAGAVITTGVSNTFVGMESGTSVTTGQNETGIGDASLLGVSGPSNSALGVNSGLGVTTGSSNTIVGAFAGYGVSNGTATTTGSLNTFLGFNARQSAATQLTNAAAIGANAFVSASNTIQLGAAGTLVQASSIAISGLTSGQCVQTAAGGLLTVTGSACGAGGTGSGPTGQINTSAQSNIAFYSVTGSSNALSGSPGISVTTVTASGLITAGSITVNGIGDGVATLTIGGVDYRATSSSTSATNSVGHMAVWSSTNGTLVDGGVPGVGGGGSGDMVLASTQTSTGAKYFTTESSVAVSAISTGGGVAFKASAALGSTAIWVDTGSIFLQTLGNNQVVTTDGNHNLVSSNLFLFNGSTVTISTTVVLSALSNTVLAVNAAGVIVSTTVPGGTGSPGGSVGQLQFNNTTFGGVTGTSVTSSSITYTGTLQVSTLSVNQGNVPPTAPISIGPNNLSSDAQIVIGRDVSGSPGLNGHAFVDSSFVNRTGTIGYNSFDALAKINGTGPYDHYSAFQTAYNYNSTGTIDNIYGFIDAPAITTGTITHRYGFIANDMTLNSTGRPVNNFGFYVPGDYTTGTGINEGFYGAGHKNFMAGLVLGDDYAYYTGDTSPELMINSNSGTDANIRFFMKDNNIWDIGAIGATDRFGIKDINGIEYLSMRTGGNVGIGTTNPVSKLTVSSGILTVNGSGAGLRVGGLSSTIVAVDSTGLFVSTTVTGGGTNLIPTTNTWTGGNTFTSSTTLTNLVSVSSYTTITTTGTLPGLKIIANGTYGTTLGTSGGLLMDFTGGGSAAGMGAQFYTNAGAQSALGGIVNIVANNSAWNEPGLYMFRNNANNNSDILVDALGTPAITLRETAQANPSAKKWQIVAHNGLMRFENRLNDDSAFGPFMQVSSATFFNDIYVGPTYGGQSNNTQFQVQGSTGNIYVTTYGTSATGPYFLSISTTGNVAIASATITSLTNGTSYYANYASSGTITPNAALGNNVSIVLTSSATINIPTNAADFQVFRYRLIQDAVGSRNIYLGTGFAFGVDVSTWVASTAASKEDYLGCIYRASTGKCDVISSSLRGY